MLVASCGAGLDTYTVKNDSSQELTIYHSESSGVTYTLAAGAQLSLQCGTVGGIYAQNMPYSVYRDTPKNYTVTFKDKPLYKYEVYNGNDFDVLVIFTDTNGNSATATITKENSASIESFLPQSSLKVVKEDGKTTITENITIRSTLVTN